jgi:CHASE2 domain-containing sensor protein
MKTHRAKGKNSALVRRWTCLLTSFCLGIFFFTNDLFGLRSLSDAYSNYTVNRVLGWFYPDDKRSSITTILADAEQLSAHCENSHTSHRFHANLLRELVRYQPRAIFIDVLLLHERPGTDQLAHAIADAAAADIPVFIAANPDPSPAAALPVLTRHARPVAVRFDPEFGEQDRYCFASNTRSHQACTGRGRLPTALAGAGSAAASSDVLPSAALAL